MVEMKSDIETGKAPTRPGSSTIRLEPGQAGALSVVLGRAFFHDPNFIYMIPDESERRRILPDLFRVAIRASQIYGEAYTTPAGDGAALWIRPGNALNLWRAVRAGFLSIPFSLGWANFRRSMHVGPRLEEAHNDLAKEVHWYLMVLGVDPTKQGCGIGRSLIEPVILQADTAGVSCYLETFSAGNLLFYKRQGFQIAAGGNIPNGGPDFWAMIRPPAGAAGDRAPLP